VGVGPVTQLSGKPGAHRKACRLPTSRFTGRVDILSQLEGYFFPDQTSIAEKEQRIFVLYGLGGAGKTQIALTFIKKFDQWWGRLPRSVIFGLTCFMYSFWNVYDVDASSERTMDSGFEAIAREEGIGETAEDALLWLSRQHREWLLFLDNADDPDINLRKYFPSCNHGNIIVTSRNGECCVHAPSSNCHVSGMNTEEAICLLLGFSTVKDSAENHTLASQIVDELGYLALAIVQAGAYISKGCSLDKYLTIFQKDRTQLMSEQAVQTTDDYPWAVYITWDISFKKLSPLAATLLHLCAL
jgi:NB-ARC domain